MGLALVRAIIVMVIVLTATAIFARKQIKAEAEYKYDSSGCRLDSEGKRMKGHRLNNRNKNVAVDCVRKQSTIVAGIAVAILLGALSYGMDPANPLRNRTI